MLDNNVVVLLNVAVIALGLHAVLLVLLTASADIASKPVKAFPFVHTFQDDTSVPTGGPY